jgi:Holliday junction resolvase
MKKEAKVVRAVMKLLRSRGAKVIKTCPPGVESGTPDILACWRGWMFAVECKSRRGLAPTPLQERRLREWKNAGAIALCVGSADAVEIILAALEAQ